jgi:hypothetical protein
MSKNDNYKPLVIYPQGYPSGRLKPTSKKKENIPRKLLSIAIGIAIAASVLGSCYIGLLKNERHLEAKQKKHEEFLDETIEKDQEAVDKMIEEIRQRGK